MRHGAISEVLGPFKIAELEATIALAGFEIVEAECPDSRARQVFIAARKPEVA